MSPPGPPSHQGRGPRQPLPAASPGQRLARTHLKQREKEAQRGPATSPRSHSAAARSGAKKATVPAREGAQPPYSTHSRSCPRAPAPPRTPSGQRPWCATGPRAPHAGRGLPGLRCARAGWRRGDSGTEPVPRGARAASYSGGRRSGAVLALARFPRGRGGGKWGWGGDDVVMPLPQPHGISLRTGRSASFSPLYRVQRRSPGDPARGGRASEPGLKAAPRRALHPGGRPEERAPPVTGVD